MSTITTPNDNVENKELSQREIDNLQFIEEEIETSSLYFKPKPGKDYLIKIDPMEKIMPRDNDRFKDANGKPIRRYEIKITHVNNGKEQLWEVSKTVCRQILEVLRRNKKVMKVIRTGADRSTTYSIEGIQ